MDQALIVFHREGEFKIHIRARDISSREHARKLWPMVTQVQPRKLVTWVSPSLTTEGKLRSRSHFRKLPASKYNFKKHFENTENSRQRYVRESKEHQQAKILIKEELSRRLMQNLAMPWYFKDESASDFHLAGNLLLGADNIVCEHKIDITTDCSYRLDIAVLSSPINHKPIVLGGIEIEFGHVFEGRKALIGKFQGFPLISIDISNLSLDQITPQWAEGVLTATTRSSESGERKTYVYLHDLLYPLYAQLPNFIDNEHRHQFLVFAKDDELNKLHNWLNKLREELAMPTSALNISPANAKSKESKLVLENAGDIVGSEWRILNDHQCLQITINRPTPMDVQLHFFHIIMARLLLSNINALVGYKYERGLRNDDSDNNIWVKNKWISERREFDRHRVLPKRLAIPSNRLLEVLEELN